MLGSINTLQHTSSRTRPRSATATSMNSNHDVPNSQTAAPRLRPPHLRSRSYLSPVDPKSRNALTMPTESGGAISMAEKEKDKEDESSSSSLLPRIHLPGHRSRHAHAGLREEKAGHGHGHRHEHGHRHTRSEMPANSGMGTGSGDASLDGPAASAEANDGLLHPSSAGVKNSMLTRMASNLSSRNPYTHPHAQEKPRHQYSTSDFHKGWNAAAAAVAGGSGGRPNPRRRATSDPKTPAQRFQGGYGYVRDGANAQFIGYGGAGGALNAHGQFLGQQGQPYRPERKPMTEIEVLLYKAEKARREADENVTEADVQRLTTQLAESNVELQEQLAGSNRTASDLMRRLDDAHESLLSTASSLIDNISSFQNLVMQTRTLIGNFEHRAKELDDSTRKTLEKKRKELFDAKGKQVQKLEERSSRANEKAEELSRRLENCRTIVRNFQDQELTKRRAWKGLIVGSLWGVALIVLGLLLGLGLWWYRSYGNIVKHDVHEALAMAMDPKGVGHLHVDEGKRMVGRLKEKLSAGVNETERVKTLENVPEDVKVVLQDIASRHESAKYPKSSMEKSKTRQLTQPSSKLNVEDDGELKKLFEKLEL